MTAKSVRQCAWTGIGPESSEEEHVCGKSAVGYVEAADGHRVFTCEEHVSHAKAAAGRGAYFHRVSPDDQVVPITSHAATKQERHSTALAGEFY